MRGAGTREPQILVDHTDLLLAPAEGHSALGERVLTQCRLAIVLDLAGTELTDVDECGALQMAGG